MSNRFLFSSESVSEGHPDKIADYISDSILDACIQGDPDSRVACETLVKNDQVVLAGEITTRSKIDVEEIVRNAIRQIGYTRKDDIFNDKAVKISNFITEQSSDIAQGVDEVQKEGKDTAEQGSGDQGIMFGYAVNETPELMPLPIMLAHKLNQRLAHIRKTGGCDWLMPDSKTQVAVKYENNIPVEIENVIISTQHLDTVTHKQIRDFCIDQVIKNVIPKELLTVKTEYFINPTGRFVIGGPESDAGLTGRKIIVDTYGGSAKHGGGAFSGKDPTKVDRSAAYMCRWVAKNIVAAGLASKVELQIAYAIGYPNPTSILVETFGTGVCPDELIEKAVRSVFSFKPVDIIKQLDLLQPIYRKTTNYGHFTKEDLPWEQTTKINELNSYLVANGVTSIAM